MKLWRLISILLLAGLTVGGGMGIVRAWQIWNRIKKNIIQIAKVAADLKPEGVHLLVATMPHRREIAQSNRSHPLQALKLECVRQQLRFRSVDFIELAKEFGALAQDGGNYDDNWGHLSDKGRQQIGRLTAPALRAHIEKTMPAAPKRIVVMGECFATDLSTGLAGLLPGELTSLRRYTDPYGAYELLHLFPDTYVKNVDLIVWLLPESALASTVLPPFAKRKLQVVSSEEMVVEARALTEVGFKDKEWTSVRQTLVYPNALAEIAVQPINHGTEASSEPFIAVGYIAVNKMRTNFDLIRPKDRLLLRLVPLAGWIREHPEVAGEFYFRRVDDFLMERFFVVGWTVVANSNARRQH